MWYCFGMSLVCGALSLFYDDARGETLLIIGSTFLVGFIILAEMRKGDRRGS